MPSNVESILYGILTGDGSGIQKPASRVEELLFEIYEQGGGGGGDSVIGGIKLTIDENYVMTATLVDKDGEEYGVSDDIDLPLEEMVVDAEYDPQTQKIKLELKNGNYVEFSVAELVSGLQTELSSSNKLNPAYIAYDASHRAVSDTEKNTWNAKQNAISDLEAIRSGASAGATAVQPSALENALSAKQDTISDLAAIRSGASAGATAVQPETMSTALALKQDSLSEAQLAAVNSGIDSTKVEQIGTNQTNILYSLQTGVKNLFNPEASGNWQYGLSSYSADAKTGTISMATTASDWARTSVPITLPAGEYKFCGNVTALVGSAVITGNTSSSGQETAIFNNIELSTTGTFEISFTLNTETPFWIAVYANFSSSIVSNSVTITGMMICTKAAWDQEPNVYRPFARPNTDLTRLMTPFFTVPINHNMIYRGQNLGETLTADQDTALSSGNFTDLYLGDYWTKQITIPAFYEVTTAEPADWSTNYTSYYTESGDTYTPVSGDTAPTWAANTYYERLVPAQTVTLKAVIADFDTFYAGYASTYAGINTHHAAVIVTGFSNVVWNKTNSTAGGYVASLIHKWLVGSALPQIETWFGSAKVLSHQKLLTNAITGDAASGWAWSSQKISLLSENQMYGSKVWGNSKASNGGYEPGEAFKHLNVFNHIDANLLLGNKNIWLRDIASAGWAACLNSSGYAGFDGASHAWFAPAALILLS